MARTLIAFQIEPDQLAALDRAARQARNTRSGIVRLALDQFLGRAAAPKVSDAERARKHSPTCKCPVCRP